MDFFDSLSAKTKALGDSAKLNVKINEEKCKAEDYKSRLGMLVWKKYENGMTFEDADILGLLLQIKSFYANIDKLNAELEQVKLRNTENKKAAEGTGGKKFCPKCKAEISPGQKFCAVCGARIPDDCANERRCTGCGALLSDDQEFCPHCGKKYQ